MNKNEIIKTLQTIKMSPIGNIFDAQQTIVKLATVVEALVDDLTALETRNNITNAQITNLERRINKMDSGYGLR